MFMRSPTPQGILDEAELAREAARDAFGRLGDIEDEDELIEAALDAHQSAEQFVACLNLLAAFLKALGDHRDASPDEVRAWKTFRREFPALDRPRAHLQFREAGSVWSRGGVYAANMSSGILEVSIHPGSTRRLRAAVEGLGDA